MPYVPMIMPETGDCAKLGMVQNPLPSEVNPQGIDPNFPTAYTYRPATPVRMNPIQEGYKISIGMPTHINTTWQNLASFRLYDVVQGEKIISDYAIGWWYKCTAYNRTVTSNRDYVDYTIQLTLAKYSTTGVGNPVYIGNPIEISGQREFKAYSNILGFDDSYIGFVLHRDEVNGHKFFGIAADVAQFLFLEDGRWVVNPSSTNFQGLCILDETLGDQVIDPKEKADPNSDGDPSGEGGGDGDHDLTDDVIGFPNLPSLSATACGFVTLYNPTVAEIQTLASQLLDPDIWQAVENLFEKPQDYVCGLGIVPVQPLQGAYVHPKIGANVLNNVSMHIIDNQYTQVDCGAINLNEFYKSALDYAPYTKLEIYLPYCGYRQLDVDEVMGKTIGVKYNIDVYNGNCVAIITANGSVIAHHSGNCMQMVPVSSASWDSAIRSAVSFATVAVATLATGGIGGGVAAGEGAILGSASAAGSGVATTMALTGATANAVMNQKPDVTRAGAIGSSIGMMSVQKPYLIKTVPNQSLPSNYRWFAGYPSNITVTLDSVSGFFTVDSIQLSGVPATEDELKEIVSLLKGGVIK